MNAFCSAVRDEVTDEMSTSHTAAPAAGVAPRIVTTSEADAAVAKSALNLFSAACIIVAECRCFSHLGPTNATHLRFSLLLLLLLLSTVVCRTLR